MDIEPINSQEMASKGCIYIYASNTFSAINRNVSLSDDFSFRSFITKKLHPQRSTVYHWKSLFPNPVVKRNDDYATGTGNNFEDKAETNGLKNLADNIITNSNYLKANGVNLRDIRVGIVPEEFSKVINDESDLGSSDGEITEYTKARPLTLSEMNEFWKFYYEAKRREDEKPKESVARKLIKKIRRPR